MTKKYLSAMNMPPRIPVMGFLWTATTLKVFEAPDWLWGVVITISVIAAIGSLIRIFTHEKVEL